MELVDKLVKRGSVADEKDTNHDSTCSKSTSAGDNVIVYNHAYGRSERNYQRTPGHREIQSHILAIFPGASALSKDSSAVQFFSH